MALQTVFHQEARTRPLMLVRNALWAVGYPAVAAGAITFAFGARGAGLIVVVSGLALMVIGNALVQFVDLPARDRTIYNDRKPLRLLARLVSRERLIQDAAEFFVNAHQRRGRFNRFVDRIPLFRNLMVRGLLRSEVWNDPKLLAFYAQQFIEKL